MAKRSYTKSRSKLEEDTSEDEVVSFDVPQTTTLVLTKQMKKNVIGPVTGKLYVFDGAGSSVDVDNEDVEGLLAIRNPNNCCSGTKQQPYFIKLE